MEVIEDHTLQIIKEVLFLLFAPATIVGAVTYLAKQFINGLFTSKQKEYELNLKNKLDVELHTYKETLENENLRYRVKVAGVYERQAEVLIELYKKINDVDREVFRVINYASGNSPLYDDFKNAYWQLKNYFNRNKILLPVSIGVLIEGLLNDAFWSVDEHESAESSLTHTAGFTAEQIDELFVKKREAGELSKTVPAIKSELEDKLRELIGVLAL